MQSLLLATWLVITHLNLLTSAANPSDTSGLVEVDLVFPRNDTYSPTPVFPIIFSFQNSVLAPLLDFQIDYTISSWRDSDWRDSNDTEHRSFHVRWANWSSSDPYFEYKPSLKFDVEGEWSLFWRVRWVTCLAGSSRLAGNASRHSVNFTIKNGSQPVDIMDATRSDTCDEDAGFAVNVTDVHRAPLGAEWTHEEKCAEVATTLPLPAPCKVEIDSVTAQSISASMTDSLCRRDWGPPRWGPPEGVECSDEESGAKRMILIGGGCLMAFVASLVHVFVW